MKANKELWLAFGVGFLVFLGVTFYFMGPLFKGKQLRQSDITQYLGVAQETKAYAEKGEKILWTNSMFSGMPNYVFSADYSGSVFVGIHRAIKGVLPYTASLVFLLMLNFFILLLVMKADPWVAIAGGIAFAFSTYFIVVLAAGHNSKVDAILWLPGIFAGLYMAYRRNIWLGAALFGFYLTIEIRAGHPQMTYYFSFVAIAFVLTEFIGQLIENKAMNFIKASALLALVAVLALGSNWSYLKTTNDYAKYSTRGRSELTDNKANATDGLDRDYVTQWSNGVGETWSFLVPNIKGGASANLAQNKDAVSALNAQERRMIEGVSAYWGDQPSTGGPVYVGAGVFLLFIFSLFFLNDRIKWPLLFGAVFLTMLSWGHNFRWLTDLMLDYFPMYHKFRAVVSAVIVPELAIPILAFLGLSALVTDKDAFNKKFTVFGFELAFTNQVAFLAVSGVVFFIVLLMLVVPDLFTGFYSAGEYDEIMGQLKSANISPTESESFLSVIETARRAILRADVLRTLFVLVLTIGLVWSYGRFRYNKYIFAAALLLITAGDMVFVSRRYLNDGNFVPKTSTEFKKSPADTEILRDPDPSYRVANLDRKVSLFNDGTTSYYHKSIGGYNGAKLKKYQELIERGIYPDLQKLFSAFGPGATQEQVMEVLKNIHVLNMLNTRYYILDANSAPLRNPYALGNAWFPEQVKWVDNADQEMAELLKADTRTTAVADKKFESQLGGVNLTADSVSSIRLVSYDPDKMEYESKAATEKVAVFSEVWYPEGWFCYIDGTEVPIGRANYILRAVKVPAGQHKVEFVFNPRFHSDENISRIFSIALLLLILGFVGKEAYPYLKKK